MIQIKIQVKEYFNSVDQFIEVVKGGFSLCCMTRFKGSNVFLVMWDCSEAVLNGGFSDPHISQ